MKRVLLICLTLFLLLSACSFFSEKPKTVQLFAMDTVMSLTAYGANAESALNLAEARINGLDALLSATKEDSEIYAANHCNGQPVSLSEDTAYIIAHALSIGDITDGALDISIYPIVMEWGFTTGEYKVPDSKTLARLLQLVDYTAISLDAETNTLTLPAGMEIDLGSIAKGYTGDEVISLLSSNGITSAIISLGGNVQTLGTKPDGSLWTVAVKNPDGDDYLGTLSVADQAVVTSGGYERYFTEDGVTYHHIIDPSTGYPANSGLVSVTIVSSSGILADGLSTSLFVMGLEDSISFWRSQQDFEAIFVSDDGTVYLTEGLQDSFSAGSGVNVQIVGRQS